MAPVADKKRYAELTLQRRWYADELRWNAKLQSERLVEAFATVPREAFLGPGPWHIHGDNPYTQGYTETSDADPRHLSHNVLVAIDVRRGLNNGSPSFVAWLIDQLDIKDGETVYHVGCGTGYYSAIMAQMAGEDGRVVAVEVDKTLARRARRNLEAYRNVKVVNADGFAHNPGHVDAILVNAGVTHLSQVWLRELRAKGRLVVPLTTKEGRGRILKATQNKPNWHAQFISDGGFYHCVGARNSSAENLLRKAFAKGGAEKVRSLRLDEHERNRGCWLHGPGFCLSRRHARKAIKVAPATLASYAGSYLLEPGFALTVTVEDGKLIVQGTNQAKFQVFAESSTHFFCKPFDAQISFVPNSNGTVGTLILHQHGRDREAVRQR